MDNCIFCKIISGEFPAFKIYEDSDVIAILDISPLTMGHTLIIPKKHVANIFDMDSATGQKIIEAATKISNVLKDKLNLDGLNLHQSNGEAAGQTVFHFHMHMIPRYKNDSVNFDIPKIDTTMDAIKETAQMIGMIS